jgi:hypothetical protein
MGPDRSESQHRVRWQRIGRSALREAGRTNSSVALHHRSGHREGAGAEPIDVAGQQVSIELGRRDHRQMDLLRTQSCRWYPFFDQRSLSGMARRHPDPICQSSEPPTAKSRPTAPVPALHGSGSFRRPVAGGLQRGRTPPARPRAIRRGLAPPAGSHRGVGPGVRPPRARGAIGPTPRVGTKVPVPRPPPEARRPARP